MPTSPSKAKIALVVGGILLLSVAVLVEWQFDGIRVAPRIDRATYLAEANLVLVVQPEKAPAFIQSLAHQISGKEFPVWVLGRILPYEMGIGFTENEADGEVDITVYGSLKRFAAVLRRIIPSDIDNEISWEPDEIQIPSEGIVLATGSVETDVDAQEQVLYQWGTSGRLVPKTVSGNHFFEVLFDNRAGQAYLSLASMMTTFDVKFSEKNMKVMLSSIQFVTMLRAYIDVSENDVMSIAIDMDIIPSARNRVGVINLKGAIDEGFAELAKHQNESHGILIEGSSNWNEMTIEFRYTIDNATPFVAQYRPVID